MVSSSKAGISAAEKQRRILAYLQASRTCHTLKDLERTLPPVASINGMQVKDHIQALTDEGQLHVEKIGSGNWYWAWGGEEKKAREKTIDGLSKEVEKIQKSTGELEARINTLKEEQRLEEERNQNGTREENEKERMALMQKKEELEIKTACLETEIKKRVQGDGAGSIAQKEADIVRWKQEAQVWTDNIYILEEYLKRLTNGDREVLDAVRRECYGLAYVEGEGLADLDF
ncbi:meiotic nuclear division protein 1 [Microsporum canis CBS 113480]|uniref:Meiotic nuclear division protein 1 n=1 Tax=Arthroderma otae (strain ATCC MYA-4605 / CBS 113480) TaxID=554155 RepID=C5FIM3_ARTOC|nr:meiotic nuclear division protein 1 [Microsporum canis CBS 113480]EEQ29292.1 meiotic nuclear division protein 1 [Microsporum canis CBS 113480]